MRTLCLLGAVLVVLIANAWSARQALRNREPPVNGRLLLSEREAPLEPVGGESSVTLLRLMWTTVRLDRDRFGPTAWLDTNKLAELGFDCSVPIHSPRALRHYDSLPGRPVFLALHCAPPDSGDEPAKSCLKVIDAALEPATLRARYPDPDRYAIARGTVRISLRRHDEEGRLLPRADLVGWVARLTPELIFVPKPLNRALTPFRARSAEQDKSPPPATRYSVLVNWGRNCEPWISEIR